MGGTAGPTMSNFRSFVADKAPPGGVFYFIESTALDAVEGDPGGTGPTPPSLHEVDPDQAVKDIAAFLTPEGQPEIDPSLVVMVHGFNTPRKRVLELYEKVRAALVSDGQIFDSAKRRIVCIGYRWPSEGVFTDLGSTIGATPNAALVALALVCVFLVLLAIWTAHWAALLGILTAGTLIMAAALRGIVYFRDVYRATNNGVPDLVEVIRQIDLEAVKGLNRLRATGESQQRKRIALSFIGHSMGGLMVVSAIRVLSDVFDPDAILTKLSGAPRSRTAGQAADDQVSGTI